MNQTSTIYPIQDTIVIRGLAVPCVIGCLAWERQIEQPLQLDLVLYVDLQAAALSDDLSQTLNYAEICQVATITLQTAKAQLLERAALAVLTALFEQFERVQRIHITLTKPAIIAAAQAVGITLERTRDCICPRTGE